MQKTLLLYLILIAGCASAPQPPNTEISPAAKEAGKVWGFCVFKKAEEFALGSDSARLVAETAMGLCERESLAWKRELARDNLHSSFRNGYIESLTESVKTSATSFVLKKRAAAAQRGT